MNTMSDRLLLACTLSTWAGDSRCCRWCDKPLTGRQRRWCSDDCAGTASANHWFGSGRWAALERDGRACVRCQAPETHVGTGGLIVPGRLEVHHRDERADGRHSECSCAHHVAGLETLCRDCHLAAHRPDTLQLQLDAA